MQEIHLNLLEVDLKNLSFVLGTGKYPMDLGGFLAHGLHIFFNFARFGSRNDFVG